MTMDKQYGIMLLYSTIFNNFFSERISFDPFARLIHSARHLTSHDDGRIHHLAQELHTLVEWTEDDPEVLAEINRSIDPSKNELYLSVEQAMPRLRQYYEEIEKLYKPYLAIK